MPSEVNLVDLTCLENYTKNKEVSRAWTVKWYGFRFCHSISFIASNTYGADRTWSLAFSYCLVSTEHDLAHGGFPSALQQNFPGLLVCNARKRKHSCKMAVNFPSDGRLGPIFFVGMKTTRIMPLESNLVDLTFLKNYTKNKEVSRAWTVQWYGFCFCRRISFIASDTYGADVTRSLAFSYCLLSSEHDLAHGGFFPHSNKIFLAS